MIFDDFVSKLEKKCGEDFNLICDSSEYNNKKCWIQHYLYINTFKHYLKQFITIFCEEKMKILNMINE